jgi:hypothetical protein
LIYFKSKEYPVSSCDIKIAYKVADKVVYRKVITGQSEEKLLGINLSIHRQPKTTGNYEAPTAKYR